MKTAVIYYSKHHGNTKKLLDAIAAGNELTLIDVTAQPPADLSGYDRIGFASGIYYSSFARQLLDYARDRLPEGNPRGRRLLPGTEVTRPAARPFPCALSFTQWY